VEKKKEKLLFLIHCDNKTENYNNYYKNVKTRYLLINKDINLTNCENFIEFKSSYACH
jgi:hypothetical protein